MYSPLRILELWFINKIHQIFIKITFICFYIVDINGTLLLFIKHLTNHCPITVFDIFITVGIVIQAINICRINPWVPLLFFIITKTSCNCFYRDRNLIKSSRTLPTHLLWLRTLFKCILTQGDKTPPNLLSESKNYCPFLKVGNWIWTN